MSMLTEEIRNFSFEGWLNILSTQSRDTAPDAATWYEELFTIQTIVVPRQIWGDFSSILPAPDLATAQANAAALPSIIADYSLAANAIHCTPSPNNKVFFATSTYNDLSTRMYNWILPQLIPRTDAPFVGFPSIGYMCRFWQGDPNAGGTEIPTTQDQIGARPGWFFHFGTGCFVVASNFSAISDPTDIWLTGFQYTGAEGGGGGGALVSSITQANTFTQAQVVYLNSGTGLWELALANADGSLGVALADAPTAGGFNAVYGGPITGLAGLTPGEYYYLSDTVPGALQIGKPSLYQNPLLHAETATGGMVLPYRPNKAGPTADYKTWVSRTMTASGSITASDEIIQLDGSSAVVTAQLPSAGLTSGQFIHVICIDNTNLCSLTTTGGETISGNNGYTFAQAWERIKLFSTGSSYIIL